MADNVMVTSDELIGVPEDVDNVISLLKPDMTQFTSMVGNEGIDETRHQWMEDTLRKPGENATTEGARAVPTQRDQPVMLSNQTQIFQDTMSVSNTSDRVKKYGRATETARLTVKMGLALKQDYEYAMVARSQAAVQGTPAVAGMLGSIHTLVHPDQIKDLTVTAASGDTPAVLGTFTEDNLNDALETLWTEGVDASVLMGPGPIARAVSDFAFKAPASAGSGAVRGQQSAPNVKLVAHVDIYEGPFGGPVRVVKNRVFDPNALMIFDPDMWQTLTLRGWNRTPLAILGDSREYQMLGEFSLKNGNRRSGYLFTGVAN